MIDNLKVVIETINSLKPKSNIKLIGIDGISGTGKTTLALLIKKALGNVRVITTDDFWSDDLGKVDTELLKESLLKPLSEGNEGSYEEYNGYLKKKVSVSVKPHGIIIIEGIYAFQSDLEKYYDYKIWVDSESANADERVKIRGDWDEKAEHMENIRNMENEYIEKDNPKERADLIVNNNSNKEAIPSLDELWESFK